MKSRIALFLTLLSSSLLIAAGSCTSYKETTTLAVGGAPFELDFWEQLVQEFRAKEGIDLELLRQPTDTDQRRQGLVIALESQQKSPDVFLMDVVWVAQFAASGWLEPLDAYMRKDNFDTGAFFQNVVNLADTYDTQMVALPVYIDGGLLYYREDLLKSHGILKPPETWGQLLAYALPIQTQMRKKNPNFYGFVWQGAQYEGLICDFLEFAGSNGGGILLKDRRIRLNTPQNVQALQFMTDLIRRYKISPLSTYTEMKEEQVRLTFQSGDALFERNWPYAWSLHQEASSKVKGKTGIAALPHFPAASSVSTLGGWHIGMSRFSDQKANSWKLIRFLLSYDTQKKLALKLGWNPGRKDVYRDPSVVKQMSHLIQLREVFENALPRPTIPYYTQLSQILQRYINAVLAGQFTSEEALARAEVEAQKVVERYDMPPQDHRNQSF